jgi:multicomponent Na+:H+ antiporter subunit G
MSDFLGWAAIASIFFGLFFMTVGTVGVFRFADVFMRLQAATKCLTFGFVFVILGTVILVGEPRDWTKVIMAIIFQFLTAPIAAQVVARAALLRGVHPVHSVRDPTPIDRA